jgi:hypothetical protein
MSMRTSIELAVIRARLKLQRGECMASPVPRAIDVLSQLREIPGLDRADVSDVRMLCACLGIRLADSTPGDSQRPPRHRQRCDESEWHTPRATDTAAT